MKVTSRTLKKTDATPPVLISVGRPNNRRERLAKKKLDRQAKKARNRDGA